MLLPTIKLIPELETALLLNLIYDDWWHRVPAIIPDDKKRLSSFHIKDSSTDFITNLCDYDHPQNCEYMLWTYLSCNPAAMELLLMFQKNICFSMLAYNTNPDAMGLIEPNLISTYNRYCQHYNQLSSNPSAVRLLKKYKKVVNMGYLMFNPNPELLDLILQSDFVKQTNIWDTYFLGNINSIDLFLCYLGDGVRERLDALFHLTTMTTTPPTTKEQDIETLKNIINEKVFSWYHLSSNPHPYAIKILRLFPENIHSLIVTNPCDDAYDLIYNTLKEFAKTDRVIVKNLCKNTNPRMLKLLDDYSPDLYDWCNLCINPAAISILVKEEYRHRISPIYLLQNPNIFVYNYENMRRNTSVFKEELTARVLRPSNIVNWMKQGYDEFLEYKDWVV
jgi:hypothetical protein